MKKLTSFDFSTRSDYDPNKTISSTSNQEIIKLLNEFPEYVAGWNYYITNVGVIKFTKGSTDIYYDLLSEENSTTLDSVNPDTSILAEYTYENNPFRYRLINFKNGEFVPYRTIIKGNDKFVRINADYIKLNDNTQLSPGVDGWFTFNKNKTIKSIHFYYKQSFYLKGNVLSQPVTKNNFTDPTKDFCIAKNFSDPFGFDCAGKTGYLEVR